MLLLSALAAVALSVALALAGIAAYLRWREARLTLAVGVASALMAAAGLAYPLAAVEAAALLALALVLDARRQRVRHVGIVLAVGVVLLTP